MVVEEAEQDLMKLIALLQQELFEIRGTTTTLDRTLKEVKVEVTASKIELGELEAT